MRLLLSLSRALALALLAVAPGLQVQAQNPTQTARAFLPSPVALGMGDAAVAFPARATAFFYNPAHLATTGGLGPSFEIAVQPNVTSVTGLTDQYDYINNRLLPAVRRGLDRLSASERRALYEEALALGEGRTSGGVDGSASLSVRLGSLGLGGGLFGRSFLRYNVRQGGAGIPELALASQNDVSLLLAGAFDFSDFGLPGLALGATAKVQRRYLAFKDKPIDAFSATEQLYVQEATATGLDLAATYEVGPGWLPGRLRLGTALYDVGSTGFDYAFKGRTVKLDRDAPVDEIVAEAERARAQQDFELAPSYRVGVSYMAPSLFGLFGESGVALDYQGYSDPGASRAFNTRPDLLTRLHLGAQVQLARRLALRTGLSQGYPSVGGGVRLGPVRLDYAFSGQEDGRRPGEAPVWQHLVRLGLGF